MKRILVAFLVAAATAGGAVAQAPSGPASQSQRSAPAAITPAPASADTCGATALAGVIGQSRTQIPIPVDPSKRRVVCTTCPRTLDYRADRLTVFYDAQTSRVTTLQCG